MSSINDSKSEINSSNVFSLFKTNENSTKKVEEHSSIKANQASSSKVLKADDLNHLQVNSYQPKNIQVPTPSVIADSVSKNIAVENLKNNLNELKSLHSRLRFMLQELETFIDE